MNVDEKLSAQGGKAGEAGSQLQKCQMTIGSPSVADREPLEMSEPGEGPLHNPAMLPEPLSGSNAAARDPGKDSPDPTG
jgi:hypothetical protein